MDIKHVLSRNPLRPAYDAVVPDAARRRPPRRLDRARRRARRDRPRRRRASLRQRAAPPPGLPRALRPRRPAGHLRRVAGLHRRRRLPPARAVAVRRLGHRPGRAAGTRRCTGDAVDDGWQVFTLGGPQPVDPGRAGLPRQLLRGRRLRPLGRRPAADRGRVGGGRRRPTRCRATSSTTTVLHPHARPPAGDPPRSATSGSGPRRAYSPYPGFAPAPGAVGEYNGKFMVNQHVLRGGVVRRPRRTTSGRPTGTSSRRRPAGPSPACGWPGRLSRGTSDRRTAKDPSP